MSQVPLVSSNLATVCIESLLYGIFFVLSASSIYLLIHRHKITDRRPHFSTSGRRAVWASPMLISAIALTVTITGHFICTSIRLFQAFVLYQGGTEPLLFYADIRQTTEVVKTGLMMATLAIGDAMVTYRVWIVWNHNLKVLLFPSCTLVGLIICGIGITYQFSQYTPGEDVFESKAGRWITSDCVFTLCTNVYGTAMISWRIWRAHTAMRRIGGGDLMTVAATFVESAVLYTTWTLLFFITYHVETNVQFPVVDTWSAITGIAFMLINVRVGLGWALTASQIEDAVTSGGTYAEHRSSDRAYALRPVAVRISAQIDSDRDGYLDNGGVKGPCSDSMASAAISV